jgi:sugar lactone lactonase YvrE
MKTSRIILVLGALVAVGLLAAGAGSSSTAAPFPATIALPNGFQPEGIAIHRARFFVGSIPTGAIYSGSLRTGQGSILVPGVPGVRAATGIEADGRGRLFVAGAGTGHGYVYDARTGALLHDYTLTPTMPSFINDVVVTPKAVFFTDSFNAFLYKLALGPGGSLPAASTPVQLTGDIQFTPGAFNANGIDATPSGKTLVIVQSNTGFLFRVTPAGLTDRIELAGGATVTNGDGILLDGKTLYVVRNQNNEIAVVRLAADLASGSAARTIAPVALGPNAVPTTVDEHGNKLYAVNARFGVPSPTTATYNLVKVRKR